MPAPGPYNSKNLPPIPQTNPPYGGSEQNPVYFWNASLPEDDIVCSVDYKNVSDSCCPFSFGIRDEFTTGCRMHNTTENTEWFRTCTKQIWGEVTARPQDAIVNCVSWPVKMRFTEDLVRHSDAAPTPSEGRVDCTVLGYVPDNLNYTARCCEQLGGKPVGWTSAQDLENKPDEQKTITDMCSIEEAQAGKWNECMSAFDAYPLCHGSREGDSSKGDGSGALPAFTAGWSFLVVAAALAAVV